MAHRNARLTPIGRLHLVQLQRAGYTQERIGEMVGVSRQTVRKWCGQ